MNKIAFILAVGISSVSLNSHATEYQHGWKVYEKPQQGSSYGSVETNPYGSELIGIYSAYDDALKIGYDKFGVDKQFLVKKIMQSEEIHYVNRGYCTECPA